MIISEGYFIYFAVVLVIFESNFLWVWLVHLDSHNNYCKFKKDVMVLVCLSISLLPELTIFKQ